MPSFTKEMDLLWTEIEPYLVMNKETYEYDLIEGTPSEIIKKRNRLHELAKKQEEYELSLM